MWLRVRVQFVREEGRWQLSTFLVRLEVQIRMSCAGRTLLKLCVSSCEARIIVVAGRVVSLNEKEVPVRMGLRSINAIAHVTRQAHIPKWPQM